MKTGSYGREVTLYRAATLKIEVLPGDQIFFGYQQTSFAPVRLLIGAADKMNRYLQIKCIIANKSRKDCIWFNGAVTIG
jgi:hypothetical protein